MDENEKLKTKVKKLYGKIKSACDPNNHILNKLFEEGVLTSDQTDIIYKICEARARMHELLNVLFQTSHPEAFIAFRKSLQEEYGWLVEEIDKSGSEGI